MRQITASLQDRTYHFVLQDAQHIAQMFTRNDLEGADRSQGDVSYI